MGYIAARGVFDYARGINLVEGGRLAGAVERHLRQPQRSRDEHGDVPAGRGDRRDVAAPAGLRRLVVRGHRRSDAGDDRLHQIARRRARSLRDARSRWCVLGAKVRPGFAAIVVVSVLAATPFMPQSFWTRMASMFDEQDDKQQFTGSREARRVVMQEGINTFLERPFTGVGAGQFKNYNPPGRKERWRETHNALIQVAAETGVLGLLAFCFLIVRAAIAAAATRRMLSGRGGAASPIRSARC